MSVPGTMGKIAIVDLDAQVVSLETPNDELYLSYLGGYGLGAYYLYKMQRPGVDPLGPYNHLGFFTGLLTGTPGITSNRYVVVAKSPKTGTWGDANSGGTFGPAMKRAGFDGVIVRGISQQPVCVLLRNGEVELVPAGEWWGWDTHQLEDHVQQVYGDAARAASIGPAGERQSLLSCIINDKGRAAGRSGLGAVMGAKRMKALVAVGDAEVTVSDPDAMRGAMKKYREFMRDQGFYSVLHEFGTAGVTAAACGAGGAPIKNWQGSEVDFPDAGKISDAEVKKYQKRRWGCWKCSIGCGGLTEVPEGEYASDTHRPEYETLAGFGALCLNDNVESINLCNEHCNRFGLDTISTAATVAFAIECYERGLLTAEDTGGLELKWGNHQVIAELTRQIAHGDGFGGSVLADGARLAADRIGKGAEQYAVHIHGEELPLQDPRLNPGLATSYKADATPGRHTQMGAWTVEGGFSPPGLVTEQIDKYTYTGKAAVHRKVSAHFHVASSAGMCMFGWANVPPESLTDSLTFVTGHEYTADQVQQIGDRIAALRMAFNVREGIRNTDFEVPGRAIGSPPLEEGPTKGVTVDIDTQVSEYLEEMGWDVETGVPTKETLENLGLGFVVSDLHPAQG